MHIGLAGPVATSGLGDYIGETAALPAGLGGGPVCDLTLAYLARGARVSLYTLSKDVVEPVVFRSGQLAIYFGPYRSRTRARVLDVFDLERRAITNAIRSDNPDVVHAHWTYEFALGALASGVPALVTSHDCAMSILRHQPGVYRSMRLAMAVRAIRNAHYITAVSPHASACAARLSGRSVTLVPNLIPDAMFACSGKRRRDKVTVLSVNNGFGPVKNVGALLRAFALVHEGLPEVTLRLVGVDFQMGGPCHAWATVKGLSQGVCFVGPIPHQRVLTEMDKATLLVHPSREEACPMVLLEAMARGLPIVGGRDSGGVPWVLGSGAAGELVDVESPYDIALMILDLLGNDPRRHAVAQAGTARAREVFGEAAVVALYMQEYARVRAVPGSTEGGSL